MKTYKTLSSPKFFCFSLIMPVLTVIVAVTFLWKSIILTIFALIMAFQCWIIFYAIYRNAYVIVKISHSGLKSKHVDIDWNKADNFEIITTKSWKYRYPMVEEMEILFGDYIDGDITKQDKKKVIAIPANKITLKKIKEFNADLYSKILKEIKIEELYENR